MGRPPPRQAAATRGGLAVRARGFTLVELVLVLIVVGALGAVAMPRMMDLTAWRLRAYSDELQAQTQAMQRLALVQRRPVVASFDTTGASFAYASGGTLLNLPCPAGSTPCIAEAGPRSITFNSGNSGRAVSSTGAALPLTVSHGSTTLALRIETETGLIRPSP
jgi:prepilin-type N-terminal cleavage/methylation domain-containing protein